MKCIKNTNVFSFFFWLKTKMKTYISHSLSVKLNYPKIQTKHHVYTVHTRDRRVSNFS